ncbi:MAG TPA: hypothetical protein PK530_11810 [Anaerolineales bacterium]|nr:hypothetical protein [Anaerolineales bacterium]
MDSDQKKLLGLGDLTVLVSLWWGLKLLLILLWGLWVGLFILRLPLAPVMQKGLAVFVFLSLDGLGWGLLKPFVEKVGHGR